MIYQKLLKPLLFSLDAERAHELGLNSLRLLSGSPGACGWLRGRTGADDARHERRVWELTFPNPVGLAAGFDKNGVALNGLAALGFGFIEIGTLTPRPQPGNDKPRIFRLPADRALINRLGFNNSGAAAAAGAIRDGRAGPARKIPLGINLGKNKSTPPELAAEDYRLAARELRELGDYFVLNVSSPNTPDLRALQSPAELKPLIDAVRGEIGARPLCVKFAPDLGDRELAEAIVAAEGFGADGFLLTNTTLARAGLAHADARETGGLSGAPLRERATAVLRALRPLTKKPLIGVGGIMDGRDLKERLDAGADLCQVYTGFVYGGPGFVAELLKAPL